MVGLTLPPTAFLAQSLGWLERDLFLVVLYIILMRLKGARGARRSGEPIAFEL